MNAELLMYAILAIIIVAIEATRARAAPYDALFLFNFSYFIYYVVAPIEVLIGGEEFTRQKWTFDHFGRGGTGVAAWVVASYVLVLLGYKLVPKFRSPIAAWHTSLSAWRWAGYSSLLLGLVALLFYSNAVGGIGVAISESSFIRAGVYEVSGAFLFAKHLIPMATVGVSFLLVARLDRLNGLRVGRCEVALWSFAIFVVVLLVGVVLSGRRTILIPLIIFFALWGDTSNRWHVRTGLVVGLVGVLVLSLWDAVGWGLRNLQFASQLAGRINSIRTIYILAMQPIADNYMHWVGIYNQRPPLWAFKDWLFWPGYLIPHAVLPVKLPSLLEQTTVLLKDKTLAETAGEPPGFQGYFFMSAGVPGLILGSMLFGAALKFAHEIFLPRTRSAREWLVYFSVVFGVTYFVRHGMLEFVLVDRVHWWLGFGVLGFWALVFGVRVATPMERVQPGGKA